MCRTVVVVLLQHVAVDVGRDRLDDFLGHGGRDEEDDEGLHSEMMCLAKLVKIVKSRLLLYNFLSRS